MSICCEKCGAKRPNLQTFTESAGDMGKFEVARCLLCGWQLCRVKPGRKRLLPEVADLFVDEETKLEAAFAKFAFKARLTDNPYLSPRF